MHLVVLLFDFSSFSNSGVSEVFNQIEDFILLTDSNAVNGSELLYYNKITIKNILTVISSALISIENLLNGSSSPVVVVPHGNTNNSTGCQIAEGSSG